MGITDDAKYADSCYPDVRKHVSHSNIGYVVSDFINHSSAGYTKWRQQQQNME